MTNKLLQLTKEKLTCYAENTSRYPGEYECEVSMFVPQVDFEKCCRNCTGTQMIKEEVY
jgi:hypothetical protein